MQSFAHIAYTSFNLVAVHIPHVSNQLPAVPLISNLVANTTSYYSYSYVAS